MKTPVRFLGFTSLVVLVLTLLPAAAMWKDVKSTFQEIKNILNQITRLENDKAAAFRKRDSNKDFKLEPNGRLKDTVTDKKKFQDFQAAINEAARIDGQISNLNGSIDRVAAPMKQIGGAELQKLNYYLSDGDWRVRRVVAEILGGNGDPAAEEMLAGRLAQEVDPSMKVVLIDALKARKASSPKTMAALTKLMEDAAEKTFAVKFSVALMARQNGNKDMIPVVAKGLINAEGKLQYELVETLKQMTGVDKGSQSSAWVAWYNENFKKDVQGGKQNSMPRMIGIMGFFDHPDGPQDNKQQQGGGFATFYGMPIKTKNVVFVIDRSGSMAEKTDWSPDPNEKKMIDSRQGGGGGGGQVPDKPDGNRKIDIAKFELIKVLSALPDDAMVNIVFYNQAFTVYKDNTMVKLDKNTREDMIKFVKALTPEGATNIYDPTEKAMSLQAGGGGGGPAGGATSTEKVSSGSPDTIFLLSDGLPNFGQIKDAAGIRAKVKQLNEIKKITINTIGVGKDADANFMQGLASDNFGSYAKR